MNKKFIYFDGEKARQIKSSLLWDESTDAWTYYSNAPKTDMQDKYMAVPTMFRAIAKIAGAVASMPFEIYGKGDTVVDSSQDYTNKLGFLPSPRQTFGMASESLDLTGTAYFRPVTDERGALVRKLAYMSPLTIEPLYDKQVGALLGFKRNINSAAPEVLTPDQVLYMWLDDAFVELGPPKAYPAFAALAASGVLGNLDDFVALYFARGAVRPIVAFVDGMPNEDERLRLKTWLTNLMGGIKNAFEWLVFRAKTVEFKQIGDGLDQLRDTELTQTKREDIAQAFGIPMDVLFDSGDANMATAIQHKRNFYEDTVVPRCRFIAGAVNEQLFEPLGYKLEYKPDTLDIFQTDEAERADALNKLTTSGMPLKIGLQVLGFELTDEQWAELEAAEQEKQEAAAAMQERFAQTPPAQQAPAPIGDNEKRADLERWRRKSLKRVKGGKPAAVDFVSDHIPHTLNASIFGALEAAKCAESVNGVFDSAWRGYP